MRHTATPYGVKRNNLDESVNVTRNKARDGVFPKDLSRQPTITEVYNASSRPVRDYSRFRFSVDSYMEVINAIMF